MSQITVNVNESESETKPRDWTGRLDQDQGRARSDRDQRRVLLQLLCLLAEGVYGYWKMKRPFDADLGGVGGALFAV